MQQVSHFILVGVASVGILAAFLALSNLVGEMLGGKDNKVLSTLLGAMVLVFIGGALFLVGMVISPLIP